jgi:hypothetical protein
MGVFEPRLSRGGVLCQRITLRSGKSDLGGSVVHSCAGRRRRLYVLFLSVSSRDIPQTKAALYLDFSLVSVLHFPILLLVVVGRFLVGISGKSRSCCTLFLLPSGRLPTDDENDDDDEEDWENLSSELCLRWTSRSVMD